MLGKGHIGVFLIVLGAMLIGTGIFMDKTMEVQIQSKHIIKKSANKNDYTYMTKDSISHSVNAEIYLRIPESGVIKLTDSRSTGMILIYAGVLSCMLALLVLGAGELLLFAL